MSQGRIPTLFLKQKIIPCFWMKWFKGAYGIDNTITPSYVIQTHQRAIWLDFSRSHKISMPYADWLLYT